MKFLDTEIENFLTISKAKIELDGKGLNLIQGVNADDDSASSNGAGKSSIVDAIFWCNYGITARGVKGDSVVNLKAKKNTRVCNRVAVGEAVYLIARHRKHATHKNALHLHTVLKDGSLVDMTRGTDAETQKEVEKILGASVEVFQAAVYSGQEAMPDLPKMGDRELKRLIEEGAGLQRIERAYGVSRERLSAAKSVVSGHQTRLDSIKLSLVRTDNALDVRREKLKQWDAARVGTIASMAARVDAAKADATLKALNAQALKKPSEEATARLAVIRVDLSAHADLQRAHHAAVKAEGAAERAIELHALQAARTKVDGLVAQLNNAAAEVSKPCAECGTPGSLAKMDEWVEHKQTHITTAKAALEAIKVRVTEQVKAKKAAEVATKAALDAVPDVTVLEAERTVLEAAISAFNTALRTAQVAKTTYDQEKLTHANAVAAVNPESAAVADLEKRFEEEEAQVTAIEADIVTAQAALEVAESVVKVFGPAGVRAQILDTVTPFLNARTADYLSVLSDGAMQAIWTTLTKSASGDLKEKFSIEVTHSKGADSFAGLSGGEKRKVRLACALALQDLVASRATQPIDLWIGDEVDDALDPSGLERLMTILERKARERGTVLVISHSDLRDWIDNVTTVTKADGVSTVEGSLCE